MGEMQRRLSSSQIIILGFAGMILFGTVLLMLPVSTRDGMGAVFSEALFTATSAVCVTGLIVRDTATYWSGFGQIIILSLIQIGGMGVVTLALAISIASGKTISLKQRSTMQEAISAPKVGGIVPLTGFIVRTTLLIEVLGAVLMAPVFCKEFGWLKGAGYALFHSISAFCNAGFDLMGIRTPFSSLTGYVSHPLINLTIMMLIITGGISFMTWDDVRNNTWHFRKYRLQTKVILITTSALILLPAIYFFFCEFQNTELQERILSSLFQTVTPRTAGFNTVDQAQLSETGLALTILLMLVGGSPGSTAGGIKTTTLAVILATAIAVFRRREHTHFGGRRISEETIRNAATIAAMYLTLFFAGGCIISSVEKLPLLTCLFESASAIATVGLSLGITPELGQLSRMILILLMYIGRVGGLTLIFSALSSKHNHTARLPQEKLTVG